MIELQMFVKLYPVQNLQLYVVAEPEIGGRMNLDINDLKASNEFLNMVYDNVTSAIFIADNQARISHFNNAFTTLFYKPEDQILSQLCGNVIGCVFHIKEGKDCGDTSHCCDCELRRNILKSFTERVPVYKEKLVREFLIQEEFIQKYFIFTTKYLEYQGKPMILVVVDDVTELEEQKEALDFKNAALLQLCRNKLHDLIIISGQLAEERDYEYDLLQEIEHRVGNNLQIILSLINLQVRKNRNPLISIEYSAIESRIKVIRLLYNHILRAGLQSMVEAKGYISSIVQETGEKVPVYSNRVIIKESIETISMSIDKAMALGLIVHEGLTNALQHAFPHNRPGVIEIRFNKTATNTFRLTLSDDGIGFPQGLKTTVNKGLGIELIQILKDQLNGSLTINKTVGVSYELEFDDR